MNKESAQVLVGMFVKNRPVMEAHDGVSIIAEHAKGEIDELLAEFQWGEREPTPEEIEKVRLELADVVWYCYQIGNLLGFDVEQAVRDKIEINEKRFPASLFQEGDFEEIYLARKKELGEM